MADDDVAECPIVAAGAPGDRRRARLRKPRRLRSGAEGRRLRRRGHRSRGARGSRIPAGRVRARRAAASGRTPSSRALSLHHVADPGAVLDKVAGALGAGGIVIVVEWDWEAFDERTARWCLQRQVQPDGWMRRRLDAWADSGEPWEPAFRGWALEHGLNSAGTLVAELDRRFEQVLVPDRAVHVRRARRHERLRRAAGDRRRRDPADADRLRRAVNGDTHDSDPAHL